MDDEQRQGVTQGEGFKLTNRVGDAVDLVVAVGKRRNPQARVDHGATSCRWPSAKLASCCGLAKASTAFRTGAISNKRSREKQERMKNGGASQSSFSGLITPA